MHWAASCVRDWMDKLHAKHGIMTSLVCSTCPVQEPKICQYDTKHIPSLLPTIRPCLPEQQRHSTCQSPSASAAACVSFVGLRQEVVPKASAFETNTVLVAKPSKPVLGWGDNRSSNTPELHDMCYVSSCYCYVDLVTAVSQRWFDL